MIDAVDSFCITLPQQPRLCGTETVELQVKEGARCLERYFLNKLFGPSLIHPPGVLSDVLRQLLGAVFTYIPNKDLGPTNKHTEERIEEKRR